MVKLTKDCGNDLSLTSFPYTTAISFDPLIKYWQENLKGAGVFAPVRKEVLKVIKGQPELKGNLDRKTIDDNRETIGLLLSAIIPVSSVSTDMIAVMEPFSMDPFFATEKYSDILTFKDGTFDFELDFPMEKMIAGRIASAGAQILTNYYKVDWSIEKPIVFTSRKGDGFIKKFRIEIITDFVEPVVKGHPPEISESQVKQLKENPYDIDAWLTILPPEVFSFKGFLIIKLSDVTQSELLSDLKFDLLKKDAISDHKNFEMIEDKIRSLFKIEGLRTSIAILNPNTNRIQSYGGGIWGTCDITEKDVKNSLYKKVCDTQSTIVVEDLSEHAVSSKTEKMLLESGFQSIVLSPILADGEMIGILELMAPNKGDLNTLNTVRLIHFLPVFNVTLKRLLDESENEIQAIIKQKATAVHPSVEWKFHEVAEQYLQSGSEMELAPVVFDNVYPMYGQADIRDSSKIRIKAVRDDLIAQLQLIRKLLQKLNSQNLPILDELKSRVVKEIHKLKKGITSGDEYHVLDLIKKEIHPVFVHLSKLSAENKKSIANYFDKLHPELEVIYAKRGEFERSLQMVNNTISSIIDSEETEAQKVYPHYFEKYRSDGIEFNMYVGESISPALPFDPIYLKNFRLWQLILACRIANKVESVRQDMPIPLEIAQLILTQHSPISITFRYDERKFDVEGTYNLRYEIVKKRIDKALIKGTNERLTQPGKIVVVYSSTDEKNEYITYHQYLKDKMYVEGDYELLDLEELPGATGLKAIRFSINFKDNQEQDKLITQATEALGN